ncbi:hypothetical protein AAW51_2562 [Caldimonas brevitalea]|uniref:Uncharacterized protein n=1 Tax=Caldimonas brevitalea TaxID=413882 RepID=A0A0G3BMN7_9BURK|nr:hypothetical protein AAW51_2562 [Caldimonas brevitalea]
MDDCGASPSSLPRWREVEEEEEVLPVFDVCRVLPALEDELLTW